jgi:hypothetical protein
MDEHQVAALLARTAEPAQHGQYELFKTTAFFDGTAKHPEWLGPLSGAAQKIAPKET